MRPGFLFSFASWAITPHKPFSAVLIGYYYCGLKYMRMPEDGVDDSRASPSITPALKSARCA